MPITRALDKIVSEGADPVDMVEMLMGREKKSEISDDAMDKFFRERKAAIKRG